jgi:hypothetical protein
VKTTNGVQEHIDSAGARPGPLVEGLLTLERLHEEGKLTADEFTQASHRTMRLEFSAPFLENLEDFTQASHTMRDALKAPVTTGESFLPHQPHDTG